MGIDIVVTIVVYIFVAYICFCLCYGCVTLVRIITRFIELIIKNSKKS